MFYTDSSNVPPEIHSALDSMSDCSGMKVMDMMAKLVKTLDKATAGSRHNPVDIDDPDPMVIDSDGQGMKVLVKSRLSPLESVSWV